MKIMRKFLKIFSYKNKSADSGGALTELLLSLALFAAIMPFVMRGQENRMRRAENIAVTRDMDLVKVSLEKYMDFNKSNLLAPVGRDITRVKLSELSEFGLPDTIINNYSDKFQLRILKSADRGGHAVLQGVLIMDRPDITPLRTREIANLGGANSGFVDKGTIYGSFGTLRTNMSNFGASSQTGISELTDALLAGNEYIWRMPSNNTRDATMTSNISMGGRDISNARAIKFKNGKIETLLSAEKIGANKTMFNTRPSIAGAFSISDEASVVGSLSSDFRDLNVKNTLTLIQDAAFEDVSAKDLYVSNLYLTDIAITSDKTPVLSIGHALDISTGQVLTDVMTIGYSGSISKSIVVKQSITDSKDSRFYWNLSSDAAALSDMSFSSLNQFMKTAVATESKDTEASQIMSVVTANQNATVSDFINAISEIKKRVTAKYNALNLE